MKIIKLSYRESCYLSAMNHVYVINHNSLYKDIQDSRKYKFLNKQSMDTINNSYGFSWILDHRFVEKYIDQIFDPDIMEMIISDDTLPEHLKIYAMMKKTL